MNPTEEIIKTALLGTDRYVPSEFGEIQPFVDKLTQKQDNKEALFLKSSFAYFLYTEAGNIPPKQENESLVCPPESLEYLAQTTTENLKSCFTANDDEIILYIIQKCYQANKLIPPELVIPCLQKALSNKNNASMFLKVCGERGAWLCQLNPEWQKLTMLTDTEVISGEDVWETGNFEQRQTYLADLRQRNPSEATEKLSMVISQENAATRLGFLEILTLNLSLDDEVFLISLLNDKSQKVKKLVYHLLLKIQGSQLNTLYLRHIQKTFIIQDKKGLLSSKKNLVIDKSVIPSEEIFSTGIDKVSSQKGFEDELYWFAQMLAYIHPNILAKETGVNELDLLELLMNSKEGKFLSAYILENTLNFECQEWALALISKHKLTDIRLLELLPSAKAEDFYGKFMESNMYGFVNYLQTQKDLFISLKSGKEIIDYLIKNPYSLNKAQFKSLALVMDKALLPTLYEVAQPKGELNYQMKHLQTNLIEMIQTIELRETLVF
jgi:hypothetical protein